MTQRIGDDRPCELSPLLHHDRSHGIRSAARLGLIAPLGTLTYGLLTWDAPRRPLLVGLAAALAVSAGAIGLCARPLARSRLRWPVNVGAVVVHLTAFAVLSYLDGGVASPLGPLVYLSLPFVAITVPPRLFGLFAGLAVALYFAVVALGGPAPPGHAYGYTMAFLGVSFLCAAHTRSLSSLRRRLTEIARIDPLTSSLNRRGFNERLQEEVRRATRSGEPLSVVLVDLDSFKAVNDTRGHHAGDTLLVWTADTLRRAARPTDAVGRLGGDEFAVILRDTDVAGAAAFARRLRVALEGTSPASLGAATFPMEATGIEEVLHLADERVYADKGGRSHRPPATRIPPECPTTRKGGGHVSSLERRRRSIADVGYVAIANWAIAVVYVVLLADARTPRLPLMALVATGLSVATGLVVGARLVARSRLVTPLVLLYTAVQVTLTAIAMSVDGGVASPIALGMLAPMPLIALTSPARLSLPVCGSMAGVYLLVGTLVGAPSGWYIALHLASMAAITGVCAAAGRLAAEQRRLLTTRSRIDCVTDCLNRRGFEQRFAREIREARHGHALCLLIVDLDEFKLLNDSQGHAAGDELLRWVSTALGQILPADAIGRLGGDEFVILLTGPHVDDAEAVVQLVRATLSLRTEASIGLATMGPDGADFDALYRHADAILYAEKVEKAARRLAASDQDVATLVDASAGTAASS